MSAAGFALLGVALGAGISALTTFLTAAWQERKLDRRARIDRREGRAALMFDHRLATYRSFLSSAQGLADGITDYFVNAPHEPPPPEDFAESLYRQAVEVELLGTLEAGVAAKAVVKVIVEYESDENLGAAVSAALRHFALTGRKDLSEPDELDAGSDTTALPDLPPLPASTQQ